ncbi:hypothetical protein VNO78_26223 [Psophocarpus tetragonolobus]|uniref:Fe2OG dioxygenase domain-containing protein n=1 Tax=Psophocarpus tetragonolobus TaxID=3891 RepID=A0AAN9X8R2_PSOTE
MGVSDNYKVLPTTKVGYDRASELKAFDDTKDGVKGLADAGVTKIPGIFHHPNSHDQYDSGSTQLTVPLIDLGGVGEDPAIRKVVVERIREASETWGFFQVVNHGIALSVLEEMKSGVHRFYEQDSEVKRELYTRDPSRRLVYNTNFDLFISSAADWRDTFYCFMGMAPNPPKPEGLPSVCRHILLEYSKQVRKLGNVLFELLSEALQLDPSHLNDIGCNEGLSFACHCYPACPEPELTLGATKHTDNSFVTVILQDHIGGLQLLHENKWVDVSPVPGALGVNIGDLLQIITNDKFKSVEHRVVANRVGPRVSVASIFSTGLQPSSKLYGPIKDLVSEDNPPKYRETTVHDYVTYSLARGFHGSSLPHFRITNF